MTTPAKHLLNPSLVGVRRPLCGGGGGLNRAGWPIWKAASITRVHAEVTCKRCLAKMAADEKRRGYSS